MSTTTVIQEIAEATNESYTVKDLIDFSDRHYGDWRDEFHKNGCVVIKNVISLERAKYYCDKQIEWLKSFDLGFDENDESTWTTEHLPISFKGGMYYGYAAPHEKIAWEARTEPAVIEIFEKLWETKELLSSFDGMNISLPRRKDVNWSPWPHCDQNPNRKGMQAVQGLVNFAPNGPKDGGLMLMKGSAKLFDEFFAQDRDPYDHEDAPPPEMKYMDLFLFHQRDLKWFEDRGCELIKVNMDPGDLVLWDSRTMHYACLPEGDQIRHVQYVCMTPKRFATEKALELKKYCFENYMGTTHWPHCNIRPSTDKPMRNGKVCPKDRTEPYEKPELTDTVLKLAGVKDY
ncbi:clavaminate synthase-like protein [Aspergillus niger]|uniref:Clavaminate synthase-like protein n=1 Tax=Aspergillus lacticoffeatus (strain CBS 101883) TaxID=1450533 RepID=UPI000D805261|nr:Clavaminate synthase-like protein [Aspergillus niger CBS 101883]PYH60044.1 Clavaminate synthase-like protein [Aspergillus niger CBS 101883]GJP94182.1 clavaminate synthase-like protein [Aspergillus niger]